MTYPKFGSIPRWYKTFTISEKIDGSNGLITIHSNELADMTDTPALAEYAGYSVYAGSRTRWISPGKSTDNHGFAQWVMDNVAEVVKLGVGNHYGEWYGSGINRGYGFDKGVKRFALFNTHKWSDPSVRPELFDVVPTLWIGSGDDIHQGIHQSLGKLELDGSQITPHEYMKPEGIVIYSHEVGKYWKKTLEHDRIPKDTLK